MPKNSGAGRETGNFIPGKPIMKIGWINPLPKKTKQNKQTSKQTKNPHVWASAALPLHWVKCNRKRPIFRKLGHTWQEAAPLSTGSNVTGLCVERPVVTAQEHHQGRCCVPLGSSTDQHLAHTHIRIINLWLSDTLSAYPPIQGCLILDNTSYLSKTIYRAVCRASQMVRWDHLSMGWKQLHLIVRHHCCHRSVVLFIFI